MNDWTRDATGGPVAVLVVDSGGVTGAVRAMFTGKDHVFVTANSGYDEPDLLFRGKSWAVSLHLWESRGWDVDPDHEVVGKGKVYSLNGPRTDAPPTFRAAILAAVTSAVAAWVEKHPEVPLLAEVNRLEKEARDATNEMNKARVAYDDSVVSRAAIMTRLQEARNHLAEQGSGK